MWTDEDELIIAENGRTYAPWIGRFLQRDPESPFGKSGIDSYVFAENSPVMAGDPTGFVIRVWQWFRRILRPTTTASISLTGIAESATADVTTTISIARTIKIPNIVPGTLTDVNKITLKMLKQKGGECAHFAVLEGAKRFAPEGYKVNLEAFAKFPDDRADIGLSWLDINRLWKAYGARGYSLTEIQQPIVNEGKVEAMFRRPHLSPVREVMRASNAKAGFMMGLREYKWKGVNKGFRPGEGHGILFGEREIEGESKLEMWADGMNRKLDHYFGSPQFGSRVFGYYRIFGITVDE